MPSDTPTRPRRGYLALPGWRFCGDHVDRTPSTSRNFVDLSHTVEHGMVTYKGLPAPIICEYMSREQSRQHYAEGTAFHIGKIEMVANTGTYIDAPFHRYAKGEDLSELPLTSLADLDGLVVRVRERSRRAIGRQAFE